jgi:hypothetical protein
MEFDRREAGAALFLSTQTISLSFALVARVRGRLSRPRLEIALAGLGRRHPLLAVRAAAREDGSAYFTDDGVPPVPLRVAVRRSDEDWVAEVEDAIRQRTAYLQGPFIRCIWLAGPDVSEIILVCDHLVGDGRAAIFALHDLLESLADPARTIEALPVPRPLPELVPDDVARQIVEDAADLPSEPAAAPPPDPSAPASPGAAAHPARIRHFDLTADETAALVARCRAEGVTVQAALCAAFLTAFAETHPGKPVRRAEIPVDLRPRLTQSTEGEYDNAVGLARIDVDCGPGLDLWTTARNAARALAGIRDRDIFATIAVVTTLTGRWPTPPWEIDYDLSISNVGRVDIPADYGDLSLEAIYGPVFPATGPDHRILAVSTFGGRMRCTFSSRAEVTPPELARGREFLKQMST